MSSKQHQDEIKLDYLNSQVSSLHPLKMQAITQIEV